jgi:Flp pilus assembly protein TadD
LARLSFNKKDFEKAVTHFRKALEVNSYDPSSWFTLGLCNMALKKMEEAVRNFSQCVAID